MVMFLKLLKYSLPPLSFLVHSKKVDLGDLQDGSNSSPPDEENETDLITGCKWSQSSWCLEESKLLKLNIL